MRFHIITLFSEMFAPLMNCGVSGRAFRDGIASAKFWNPRDFCEDARANTDDRPFGGGSGMVMRPPPLADAIRAMRKECDAPLIFLSPQGKIFNHADSRRFAQAESLALLCGRYRGIDERIIRQFADEENFAGRFCFVRRRICGDGGDGFSAASAAGCTRQSRIGGRGFVCHRRFSFGFAVLHPAGNF